MFTEQQINEALTANGNDQNKAYLQLWMVRYNETANYVDIQEGSSQRKMSQLHSQARDMVKFYRGLIAEDEQNQQTTRGARISRFVRVTNE